MPTKDIEVRPLINSQSMSDSLLHFISIFTKTNAYGYATADRLYELNKTKYKKRDNFEKALSRLLKMGLVSVNISPAKEEYYLITNEGIDCIYKLAMLRRKKNVAVYVKQKSRANQNGTHFDPDSI